MHTERDPVPGSTVADALEAKRIDLHDSSSRRRVSGSGRRNSLRWLDEEEFRQQVRKERERSDRTGRPFSVLFVTLQEPRDRRRMVRLASDHLRLLDDIGQVGDLRLGILLPETPIDGARTLEQRLLEGARQASIPCAIKSYAYGGLCETPDLCGQVSCSGNCVGRGVPRGTPLLSDGDGAPDPGNPAPAKESGPDGRLADTPSSIFRLLAPPIPWWKRVLDVLGASVLLVALSPVLALAAVAVRFSSPGPIIFRQQRVGLGGRVFWFYKFRSMYVDAEQRKKDLEHLNEAQGPVFKIARDPRITPVGRFLRVTSIDELPQLWNVLRGDMSLVGPRPPIPEEVRQYAPWHRRRLEVPGGLTCIWQVSGRCDIPFEDWMRMDLRYSRQQSLATDLALLWKTVGAVLSRRGAR